METFEKVAIAIVVFVITSVVAYLFRMRQLYAVTPKLYRHASISDTGSLCEVIVYNKGNQPEELIQVALDPDLKAELLASSTSDITLDGSTLKVERLHRGCEASAVLLVENGLLDASKLTSVSSKGTKGRVCKKVSDVPPNFALSFLLMVALLGFTPTLFYGSKAYKSLYSAHVRDELKSVQQLGWSDLDQYFASDLRKSYSNNEFPVRLTSRQSDASKKVTLTFEVYNKTAAPMKVYVDKSGERNFGSPYFASVDVEPMSRKSVTTRAPEANPKDTEPPALRFSISLGEEFIHNIQFRPPAQ